VKRISLHDVAVKEAGFVGLPISEVGLFDPGLLGAGEEGPRSPRHVMDLRGNKERERWRLSGYVRLEWGAEVTMVLPCFL